MLLSRRCSSLSLSLWKQWKKYVLRCRQKNKLVKKRKVVSISWHMKIIWNSNVSVPSWSLIGTQPHWDLWLPSRHSSGGEGQGSLPNILLRLGAPQDRSEPMRLTFQFNLGCYRMRTLLQLHRVYMPNSLLTRKGPVWGGPALPGKCRSLGSLLKSLWVLYNESSLHRSLRITATKSTPQLPQRSRSE